MSNMSFIQVVMLFGVFQGLILLVALMSPKHRKIPANRILVLFIAAIVFLLSLVSLIGLEIVPVGPRFGYLGDSVSLLYGPLFYFYVLRLLTSSNQKPGPHLIPFGLFVFINTLALIIPAMREQAWLGLIYNIMSSASLLQLAIYLALSWLLVRRYRQQAPAEFSAYHTFGYLSWLIAITSTCLTLFIINYVSQLMGLQAPFTWLGYTLGWLMLSAVIFALAYAAMRQPEIFRLEARRPSQNGTANDEEISQVLEGLKACLLTEHPYLDPELTLEALANRIGYRKELVSKAINQGLSMNFYRLINEHRIEAFEALAKDPANAHLTHLALALEAGFRSKTTFYKAFKELKQMTPAAYLKSI